MENLHMFLWAKVGQTCTERCRLIEAPPRSRRKASALSCPLEGGASKQAGARAELSRTSNANRGLALGEIEGAVKLPQWPAESREASIEKREELISAEFRALDGAVEQLDLALRGPSTRERARTIERAALFAGTASSKAAILIEVARQLSHPSGLLEAHCFRLRTFRASNIGKLTRSGSKFGPLACDSGLPSIAEASASDRCDPHSTTGDESPIRAMEDPYGGRLPSPIRAMEDPYGGRLP